MLYRVDYVLALLAAGAIAAALLSGRAARITPHRVARGYLIAVALIVALRAAMFVLLFGAEVTWLPVRAFLAAGDLGIVLLGAVYGIAVVQRARGGFTAVLGSPELHTALRLSVGIGFVLVSLGKTFSLDFMRDFFHQSHYSNAFLFTIMAIEAIAGAVLLLPWRATVRAASAALGVVMFGAIYTHWHNGEPFDYSRDAVAMLLWLAPIAVLSAGWRRAALGAAACCAAAIAGSALVRTAPAADDDFDFFVGSWQCNGTAAGGAPITAALRVDEPPGGRWLLLRFDEPPPGNLLLMTEWHRDPAGWLASVQDDAGSVGTYRSAGWQGPQLVWDSQPLDGSAAQRFTYERLDPARFGLRHESRDPGGATGWRTLVALTCLH